MKILFIVGSLALGGGAERAAVSLGNELYKNGHEITYLAFQDKNPKYEYKGEYYILNQHHTFNQDTDKIKTLNYNLNFFKNGIELIKNSLKIKKSCSQKNINTVISIGAEVNYHVILSGIFGNKSKIIATHHQNPESFSVNHKRVMKILYPKSDKVICVSKTMENIFKKKMGIKSNITTIYNMLDIENCIKLSEKKIPYEFQEIFNSGFIFINIGRLDASKGQWFLIRSFRDVVDKYNDVKLVILGNGELKKELEDLIKRLHLEKNVFLLGNHKNIFPFLKNSNCFVLSSLFEGLPISLLEALSTNLTIISTDCKSGPREILCPDISLDEKIKYPYYGKYGILTKPFDKKSIFETIDEKPLDKDEEDFSSLFFRKLIFETIDEKPLDKDEKDLAALIIKIIEEKKLRKKYSTGQERALDFDKTKIMEVWEKII
jgi:glycosyltransferase involved in cell wall biosynthesis